MSIWEPLLISLKLSPTYFRRDNMLTAFVIAILTVLAVPTLIALAMVAIIAYKLRKYDIGGNI